MERKVIGTIVKGGTIITATDVAAADVLIENGTITAIASDMPSGGHQVQFRGRRICPVKFLSKHYPIRSQAHGERKVFEERKWLDQALGRQGLHVQYNGIVPGHSFLKYPKCLMEWK